VKARSGSADDEHKASVTAQRVEGVAERSGVGRGHDGDVGATEFANLVGRRTGGGVHDVVGAELFGQRELVLGHVDGDDGRRRDAGVLQAK